MVGLTVVFVARCASALNSIVVSSSLGYSGSLTTCREGCPPAVERVSPKDSTGRGSFEAAIEIHVRRDDS